MTMFESTGFFKSYGFPNYDMKSIMELPATSSTARSNYFGAVIWNGKHFSKF